MQEKGLTRYFNSRPSARGDGKQPKKYSAEALFQFTPLREGRRAGKSQTACGLHFNSRPSARGDPCAAFVLGGVAEFQFTPLREGRPSPCRDKAREDDFNSRPSARGDAGGSGWPPAGSAISIHAPPRGATVHRRSSRKPSGDFNSRPSARGDKCINHTVSVEHISIHAPPRGATHRVEAINY